MTTRQTSQVARRPLSHRAPGWPSQGQRKPGTFLFLLSFFAVLLAACATPFSASTASALPASTPTMLTTPTSASLPTATPDPLQAVKARVVQLMAGMSLEQKLGQLIVVEYLGNSYQSSGLQYMVTKQYVGGVLYQYVNHNFDAPTNTVDGLAAFSRQMQQDAQIGLLIGTDQEGGQVNRLQVFHGYLPSAAEMAAKGDPQYAHDQGAQAGKWMAQLGINSDLAPVVDVHTVDPPVLQDRMFGKTPQKVATYAGAYLDGLQENGVAGCLKHFPGLGAISSDPHVGLPTVNRSLDQLKKIDLMPYQLMISKNHPAMIMDTDVLMPAIDPNLPAELSPKAVEGILRGYLGYDGVVITDGLYMHGISERWSLSQAAVLAIAAGNDMIEGPYTTSQVASVLTALKQALKSGQITEARVDQAVARILMMKLAYGMTK